MGQYFDTAKLFLIAAVEKFCEKNQFTQASQFITYIQKHNQTATSTQPDAASKLHLGLLGWIVTDLARAEGVQTNLVAVKEIYGLMVQSLDWHPGVPADVGTCRLILAVAMREGDASASEFLEAFSAKAEGLLQAKMLGGQPFDRIKVIAVLGKVCRQFVALYRSLTKGMADQGDVHELRFLSTLQPDQMLEIRAFAKDLLQYLAPSLQDAAFVKVSFPFQNFNSDVLMDSDP
ncbi:hypothetical protein BC830DRAFT_549501 [Chytriomyces sp. MP71]|nr:hypothetical protein BC830DRAFT_549501 [Chytriomyces sp. MP71]